MTSTENSLYFITMKKSKKKVHSTERTNLIFKSDLCTGKISMSFASIAYVVMVVVHLGFDVDFALYIYFSVTSMKIFARFQTWRKRSPLCSKQE